MSFENQQSVHTLCSLSVVALLISETMNNVQSNNLDKTYEGAEMTEAMIQNLGMTVVERELANKVTV